MGKKIQYDLKVQNKAVLKKDYLSSRKNDKGSLISKETHTTESVQTTLDEVEEPKDEVAQ